MAHLKEKRKKRKNIDIIKKIHSTMRQHNHYYRFFLHFILFWAFPPSANMFKLVTENRALKWGQLIVFKLMLWVIEKKIFKIWLQVVLLLYASPCLHMVLHSTCRKDIDVDGFNILIYSRFLHFSQCKYVFIWVSENCVLRWDICN